MSSLPSYQYQPLALGEIRLLQLLPPRPDIADDPIRFRIIHTTFARCNVLDSFFSYEALSYVWGGDRTAAVSCDDHEIMVTPNLVSALIQLRRKMSNFTGLHRTLWVDSICINQNDAVERGHQVRLMREIYSNAVGVIVWLGGSQEVQNLVTLVQQGHLPLTDMDLSFNVSRVYHESWSNAVSKVFDKAWFQRVWVIQEVAFAADVVVIGGAASCQWDKLIDAAIASKMSPHSTPSQRMHCEAVLGIEWLRTSLLPSNPGETVKSHAIQLAHLHRIQSALRLGAFARLPKDLLELAELFRSYSATDSRDKIYAILGIALAMKTDRYATRIDPDYDTASKDLFLRFARMVVSGPEALRLLRNVDGSRLHLGNLPSWVPDWGASLQVRPLAELCKSEWLLPQQRAVLFKSPSPEVLKLAGKRVDTIKALGDTLLEPHSERGRRVWERWCSLASAPGQTPASLFNWNAFAVPRDWNTKVADLPNHCREICVGRRYLQSQQNRCGLAPSNAMIGDEVVLFPGAELPFIVRRDVSDNMCYLVGECYLDRIFPDSLLKEKRYKQREYCLK